MLNLNPHIFHFLPGPTNALVLLFIPLEISTVGLLVLIGQFCRKITQDNVILRVKIQDDKVCVKKINA